MVWAPTKRGFKSKSSGTRLFSILLKSKSKTVRKEVNSWSCLIDCSFKIFYLINRLPILPKQWNQYFQFVPPLAVCLQTDTKHLRTTINFEVQYWLLKTKRNSVLCFEFFCKNKTVATQCSVEQNIWSYWWVRQGLTWHRAWNKITSREETENIVIAQGFLIALSMSVMMLKK